MPKQEVLQGGGIVVYGPSVVLRRTKAGKWIFPKGHVDPGETTLQTAVRECEEETGLRVEVAEAAGSARFKDGGERLLVDYYILRALGPGPLWDRHRDVDTFLVPPAQVGAHLSQEALRELWRDVQARVEALARGECGA